MRNFILGSRRIFTDRSLRTAKWGGYMPQFEFEGSLVLSRSSSAIVGRLGIVE